MTQTSYTLEIVLRKHEQDPGERTFTSELQHAQLADIASNETDAVEIYANLIQLVHRQKREEAKEIFV